MRGILWQGAISLMLGTMFTVAAPTGGAALTMIDLAERRGEFPESVVGAPALPEGDRVVAFERITEFQAALKSLVDEEEESDGLEGMVAVGVPSDQASVTGQTRSQGIGQRRSRLDREDASPVASGGSGALGGFSAPRASGGGGTNFPFQGGLGAPSFGAIAAPAGFPVASNEAEAAETPSVPADTEHVGSAPEPATWVMMIAGFWIVGWRLRQRRAVQPGVAAAGA